MPATAGESKNGTLFMKRYFLSRQKNYLQKSSNFTAKLIFIKNTN